MTSSKVTRGAREAGRWLKGQLIEDVPHDLALCEFDCRKLQCRMDEWAHCQRRLRALGSRREWEAVQS